MLHSLSLCMTASLITVLFSLMLDQQVHNTRPRGPGISFSTVKIKLPKPNQDSLTIRDQSGDQPSYLPI